MKKPSRLDYAYAVGRVRVLEKKLVERAVFSEAAEEKDFPCAVKLIYDAGDFAEEMVHIGRSDELDEFLVKEEKNIYNLLEEILLEEEILGICMGENHFEKALLVAERAGYSFIVDYFRHKISLGNLKILCRAKYLGLSREKFERLLLKGGFLDERILLQNYDRSYGEIGESLQHTSYLELWNNGVDFLEERETGVKLERGIEDFLMIHLRKAKNIVFGPEPVFAYGQAKKRELDLVRILGIGKLKQIPVDILKERMSETYV